jgi:hypothetical protein
VTAAAVVEAVAVAVAADAIARQSNFLRQKCKICSVTTYLRKFHTATSAALADFLAQRRAPNLSIAKNHIQNLARLY